MKDQDTVINEFGEVVNMTASELERWLKSDDSNSAGWPKEDESGESVGHDSGRKIVEILKANPNKKADKYTEEQIAHMRKVVSYCKRHLAQEKSSNDQKSADEVKKTKSYASLKNWGHDPLKAKGDDDGDNNEGEDEKVGDKRKKPAKDQASANKKRETRSGAAAKKGKKEEEEEAEEEDDDDDDDDDDDEDVDDGGEEEEEEEEEEDEDEEEDDGDEANGKTARQSKGRKAKGSNGANGNAKKSDNKAKNGGANGKTKSSGDSKKGPKPGDTVSWNWGGGQPEGKVLDVKEEKTSITTKNGNQVSRDGDEEDPAVVLDAGKSKAIKKNHELN